MSEPSISEIDFEHWATLASTDPEEFEKLRQDRISALINRTTGQRHQRLRGLQWQIDTVRAQHKNSSVAACQAISELMWDAFKQLAEVLQSQAESGFSSPLPGSQAKIIAFPKKPENQI